ncbi:DUF6265 family protein [Gelidibacter salicanalis]|uniref:PD40 domain-containing protein n=1 Tax=Gelidibacter salicanalis TaxID=291193 RepID=A0A934KNW0_9FLAO|nr:DUF6265 family protein [Gelidibacter salicanalis]MBJ7881149.1 PD40 domain-containing protein [Gelidibacter salicanalis]
MRSSFLFLLSFNYIFSFAQPNTEVFLFDLNGANGTFKVSNFKNISNNDGYDNQPSFMDNGTILYAGTRNAQTDIIKYNLNYGLKTWISFTEGGEYSPLKIPNQNAVSAIRLDPDGKQHLYRYDLKTITNEVLIKDLVIGYHVWAGQHQIVSAVLEDDGLSLYISDLRTKENKRVATNIGRSLHQIPNTDLIGFISKNTSGISDIKSFNPINGAIKTIARALPNSEDLYWLTVNSILMPKDDVIYKLDTKSTIGWTAAVSLKEFEIINLTRLAISPDGTKLAIVGELSDQAIMNTSVSDQPLAPTLENIKWIAGNWKGEAFGGQTEENWSEPSGGSMMATFKLIDNGTVVFYEIEIIREVENSLMLQLKHFGNDLKGWEEKDETIDFPLKEITPTKVVFEGMTFEKISENEMNIYVDIKQDDGSIKNVKFNYTK